MLKSYLLEVSRRLSPQRQSRPEVNIICYQVIRTMSSIFWRRKKHIHSPPRVPLLLPLVNYGKYKLNLDRTEKVVNLRGINLALRLHCNRDNGVGYLIQKGFRAGNASKELRLTMQTGIYTDATVVYLRVF